ncbi:MAG TPA: hypothetical protein VLW52_16445 [Opitutaceae bacterium]|nr:hypothetical protein [Opitutaceae bacterium]
MPERPSHVRLFPRSLQRFVAAGGVALVVLLGVLAASPVLHHWLHSDADQAGHECAVTLFLHGAEQPAAGVAALPPQLLLTRVAARPSEPALAAPRYWLPPGQAPPVG